MYFYNATAISFATVQIGNPVGIVGGAVAGVHRSLVAKHSHLVSAKRATAPALRGCSRVLSERIKHSDMTESCPALLLQSDQTEGRMSRRNRTLARPTGEPTVTSWSALLN